MKYIIALFGATLLILLMVSTMGGVTSFRSTAQTQLYNNTTAAGVTSANLTLPLGVLDDSLSGIPSVSSNLTGDAPLASSYISTSKVLNVSGLLESATRQLTVIYRYPALTNYSGVDIVAKWWPLFLSLAIIAVVVAAIVNAVRGD